MNRFGNLLRHFGFHLLLFVLAAVLFCRPFAASAQSREIVTLFTYLFVVWGVVIAILFGVFLGTGPVDSSDGAEAGKDRPHV